MYDVMKNNVKYAMLAQNSNMGEIEKKQINGITFLDHCTLLVKLI